MTKAVIAGQGYVGLPIAMRAVAAGHSVVGFEISHRRLDALRAGRSFVEDVPSTAIASALSSGRYLPTDDPADCTEFDVAIITVPTPLRDGAPDLSHVIESAGMLGHHLTRGALVVLESTTYPGTTTDILVPLLEQVSGLRGGDDFYVGYSPERIDPGNSQWNLVNTPKIVSGLNSDSLKKVDAFYGTLVSNTVPVSSPDVAELTKILENTFRHVNVALVNELAMFSYDLGIDVWEAIDAAATKPFGFMRFTPGPGVGGHCLPIDPSYLSWKVRRDLRAPFRFIELANAVNDQMPEYVVRRAMAILNRHRLALNGSRILVLGLAYKRNSGDARESPGPIICDRLEAFGATVRAVDDHLPPSDFPASATRTDLSEEELRMADLAIIVTDHDNLPWEVLSTANCPVLDTRRRVEARPLVEYL